MPLLLPFIAIAVDILLLVKLTKLIGGLGILALIVGTAVLGSWAIRRQGMQTIREIQLATARGELPTTAILEGLVALFGGVLLLLPGPLSDLVGLSLLLAGLRRRIAGRIGEGIAKSRPDLKQPVTLEGDYRRRP